MDFLQDKWADLKDDLKEVTYKQWKILGLCGAATLVFWLVAFIFIPTIQTHIREAQLESVTYPSIITEKATILAHDDLAATIKKDEAVTVIFMPNSNALSDATWEAFNDKTVMAKLNHKITLYPFVYDITETTSKYKVDVNEVTCVFFEKGKEENRYVLKDTTALKGLIEKLNALPMANQKKLN